MHLWKTDIQGRRRGDEKKQSTNEYSSQTISRQISKQNFMHENCLEFKSKVLKLKAQNRDLHHLRQPKILILIKWQIESDSNGI